MIAYLAGVLSSLLVVRLAMLHREQRTVFAGPAILWAIPATLAAGAGLVLAGLYIGRATCAREREVLGAAYSVVADRAETLLVQLYRMDTLNARPRGIPLCP